MNEMITLDPAEAAALHENIRSMGTYVTQLAGIIQAMGERIALLEAGRNAQITVRHADAKALGYLIKEKSEMIADQYGITDPKAAGKIRTEIRKSILKAYGITDLHDLPANALDGAKRRIGSYANIRLIMKLKSG